jgi:hypothetical protein
MNTAHECTTPQRQEVVRRAYRLGVVRLVLERRIEAVGDYVTVHDEYVVLSNNFAEVLAFPGRPRRSILGRERVEITDYAEVDGLVGADYSAINPPTRALLRQMGYRSVTDLAGRTTVLHEDAGVEDQGRWGQGGPGSDDYMSFGVGE